MARPGHSRSASEAQPCLAPRRCPPCKCEQPGKAGRSAAVTLLRGHRKSRAISCGVPRFRAAPSSRRASPARVARERSRPTRSPAEDPTLSAVVPLTGSAPANLSNLARGSLHRLGSRWLLTGDTLLNFTHRSAPTVWVIASSARDPDAITAKRESPVDKGPPPTGQARRIDATGREGAAVRLWRWARPRP